MSTTANSSSSRIIKDHNNHRPWLSYQLVQERFQAGDSYTWLYRYQGKEASWERYTVLDVFYPYLRIELASRFVVDNNQAAACKGKGDLYQTHHRMTISMEQQLSASDDPEEWSLVSFEYYYQDGSHNRGGWTSLRGQNNVQAFEEKFNVFVMPYKKNCASNSTGTGSLREVLVIPAPHKTIILKKKTNHSTNGPTELKTAVTRPSRHQYTNSWYACHPDELAGIALWKEFEGGEYSFELVEMQRSGIKTCFDSIVGIEGLK
ncbi:expressed unknown protein [Seminavis robusta]|uniref:Uncharacterized protein n=1 Tax=Seminavis robusta TaxID=568900 RepID=A0A9N8EMC1_9STRA|nr:expressed unknown protein [Seminavis robusta]|eukprot:Sro1220_g253580.1 n/a (262) ;mRNA; f:26494-27279